MMFMFMVMGCFFHELAIPGGSILGPWFSRDDFTVSHTVDKWFSHFYFGARNFRFDQKKKKKLNNRITSKIPQVESAEPAKLCQMLKNNIKPQ